jgi:hypothetical protein
MKPRIIMAQVEGSGTAVVMTDRDVAPTAPLVRSPLISAEKYAGGFGKTMQKGLKEKHPVLGAKVLADNRFGSVTEKLSVLGAPFPAYLMPYVNNP